MTILYTPPQTELHAPATSSRPADFWRAKTAQTSAPTTFVNQVTQKQVELIDAGTELNNLIKDLVENRDPKKYHSILFILSHTDFMPEAKKEKLKEQLAGYYQDAVSNIKRESRAL